MEGSRLKLESHSKWYYCDITGPSP